MNFLENLHIGSAITNLIAFILVFFTIVFFHELGHFMFAKFFKVKVREFFLGFGPSLFSKTYGDTKYSFRAFPLGGAVVMEGEDEHSDDPNSFMSKPLYQKFIIVIAGPMMNFLIAIIIFMIVSFQVGVPSTKISSIIGESPASKSELSIGDEIISINNNKISNWNDIVSNIQNSSGVLNFKVLRNRHEHSVLIKPIKNEDNRYIVGISTLDKSPILVFEKSISQTYQISKEIVLFIPKLFYDKKAQEQVGGPVAIYNMVGQVSSLGFLSILMFTALLSINLGIMNLLPIPALDGGRLTIYIIEFITRKKINKNFEDNLHKIGFVLLITLMIFVFFKDIRALF